MTLKQKMVLKKIVENGRTSISAAMREVGYSPNTAKAPSKLTNSIGWHELMDKYLPDDKLLKKHDEALEATKWNDFTGEREEDHNMRLKAVELGYKIKGRINDSSINISGEKVIAILGGVASVPEDNGTKQTT